ncbi:MAG: hypothetical protein OEZ40_06975 [Candidatus Bathyarchaeota archaeon]|nr:hypothetical protein [Candidatus Bathyarchaeota archaeon]
MDGVQRLSKAGTNIERGLIPEPFTRLKRTKNKEENRDEGKAEQIWGIMLGIGFMVLGILHIAYPELVFGGTTQGGRLIAVFGGSILFIAGLAQTLYIMIYQMRWCHRFLKQFDY